MNRRKTEKAPQNRTSKNSRTISNLCDWYTIHIITYYIYKWNHRRRENCGKTNT